MDIKLDPSELEDLFLAHEEGEIADALLNVCFFALDPAALGRVSNAKNPMEGYRKEALMLLDDDAKEAYARVQVGYGLDSFACLDPNRYETNPYYRLLMEKASALKWRGSWRFDFDAYVPYQLFVYGEVSPSPSEESVYVSPVGYFKERFPFPCLKQNGRTWMSLVPHEIETMAGPIEKAKGNVATYGLGLGYFAFMAAEKEEVASVTIIERDASLIRVFKENLLPLFPHKEKIRFIEVDDALDYHPKVPYDYLFVDIYHDAEDGLPLYLELLKKEGLATHVDFWIERALLTYFRRFVLALLEEECSGYGAEDYARPSNEQERLLSALYSYLRHKEIKTVDDVLALLSEETLVSIAKGLSLPKA